LEAIEDQASIGLDILIGIWAGFIVPIPSSLVVHYFKFSMMTFNDQSWVNLSFRS